MTMKTTQSVRYTILLIIICLLARLIIFTAIMPWKSDVVDQVILQDDPIVYHKLATTLLNHRQFALEKDEPPIDFRTPIYPLFIGFIYTIFGENPWIVILFQIILDTVSCILLFFIFKRFLNLKIALFASLFYALDPFLVVYSNTLYSDILFNFCIIVSFNSLSLSILNKFQKGTTRNLIVSALFLGITALVRPTVLYLALAIAVILFILLRKDPIRVFKYTAIFISVFMLSISPWLLRNQIAFNAFSLSTLGPLNLLDSYVTPMEMERRGQSYQQVTESLFLESDDLIVKDGFSPNELNRFEKSKYWQTLAFQYIRRYPIPFIKHYFLGIFHSFANLDTRTFARMLHLDIESEDTFDIKAYPNLINLIKEWFHQKTSAEKQVAIFIGTYLLISYLCLIIGLITAWKSYNKTFLFFSLFIAAYFILITGTAGLARFRLPSIPFYLPFIGVGANWIISSISNRLRKSEMPLRVVHPR